MLRAISASGKDVAQQVLALFDFDGTLTDRDSFRDFVLFAHGGLAGGLRLLLTMPVWLAFQLRLVSRQRAKQWAFGILLRPLGNEQLGLLARRYARERIPQILRPAGLRQLQAHRQQGHRVVVISASPEDWIAPWCAAQGIECLATRLQRHHGQLTGQIDGSNCRGAEKVTRLQALLNLKSFDHVIAYGDSAGDREMLAIADAPHYRPFR